MSVAEMAHELSHDAGDGDGGKRPAGTRRPIGTLFVEKGFVTQQELEAALEEQKESGQKLGEILVERGHLTRLELASAISDQWVELKVLNGGGGKKEPSRARGSSVADSALLERLEHVEALLAKRTAEEDELRERAAAAETVLAEAQPAPVAESSIELESLRAELEERERRLANQAESIGDLLERVSELEQLLEQAQRPASPAA